MPGYTQSGAGAGGYGASGYGAGYTGAPGYAVAPPIGTWRSAADDRPLVTGIGSAIRTIFSKYARFDGRAGRPEFWYWSLFEGIIFVGVYLLMIFTVFGSMAAMNGPRMFYTGFGGFSGLFIVLLWLWALATLVPGLAVTVRRLRDAGYHWALIFIALIPFGAIAVLVLCAMPSKYP
jgi:uncharacterized membrane protein YhaH (DUF805 family)